jgi:hypothetical protein
MVVLSPSTFAKKKHHRSRHITRYHTNSQCGVNRASDRMEGNCIDDKGRLRGSDGKVADHYCKYGIGVQDICLKPCESAAGGPQYSIGQIVHLPKGTTCGGHEITEVRIADRGGAVGDLDIFEGVCLKPRLDKRGRSTGECATLDNSGQVIADYDGPNGKDTGGINTAVASSPTKPFQVSNRANAVR